MAEKYVNNEKNLANSVVKGKYFPDIQKDCEVRVAYTLLYNIFQVFEEEKCPNKNIYRTLTLFLKKIEENAAGYSKTACKLY